MQAIHTKTLGVASAAGGALGTFARQARTLGHGLLYLAGANGVLTVGLGVLVKGVADAGDEVGETAAKIGISTDALQELRYAAKMSGVEITTFDSSLVSMTKNIGMAARGQGRAQKAFAAMGIDVKKLIKLKPDQQLEAIIEALHRIPNQTDRAALSMQLFGDAGKDMVLMAENGADGLQGFRAEAHRLGYVLGDQTIKDAGGFNDALDRSKFALQGLKNTIGAALMPTVTKMLEAFSEFVAVHRPQIEEAAKSIGRFFEENGEQIGQFALGIGSMILETGRAISQVLTWAHDVTGSWTAVGAAVAAVFMAPTLIAIAKVGFAVGGLSKEVLGIGRSFTASAAKAESAAGRIDRSMSRMRGGALLGLGLAAGVAAKANEIPKDPAERAEYIRQRRERQEAWARSLPGMAWYMDKTTRLRDSVTGTVSGAADYITQERQRASTRRARGTDADAAPAPVTNTVNVGGIVVNAPPGMTPAEVASLVAQKIRDAFNGATAGSLHDGAR